MDVLGRKKSKYQGFPGSAMVKNLPANAEDVGEVGSVPGWERSPGVGNGNPLPGKFHRWKSQM